MVRVLHIPFLMGLAALVAAEAPAPAVAAAGAFSLGISLGIEFVLTFRRQGREQEALHDWVRQAGDSEFECWRCGGCGAICRVKKGV